MKVKKLPTLKNLKRSLWKLTSQIVRLKYTNCYTCGKYLPYEDRQAGHFFTQGGHGGAKYDFDNLRTQCFACNHYKSGDTATYGVKLLNEIGEERLNNLMLKAKAVHRYNRDELEQMINERQQILNQKENETNL